MGHDGQEIFMQMSDYDQIRNLIARYSHYADDDDKSQEYRALFATDGVLVEGGVPLPADRLPMLRKLYRALKEKQPQPFAAKHLQMNSAIEVDGDTARAVTDLLTIQVRPEEGWSLGGAGQYIDEIVRENGEWRFKRREVQWHKGTSARVKADDLEFNRTLGAMIQEAMSGSA
jgi:3-phenylpropionate/cinnamic acid dioxygenase small subunit